MPDGTTTTMGARPEARKHAVKFLAGGATAEVAGGLGAIVLAILGLAGVYAPYLASVAVIAIGIALVSEGGAIATKFAAVLSELEGGRVDRMEIGGGMATEFMCGAVGLVLGILGVIGVATTVLAPIAVIVFGVGLMLSTGMVSDLRFLEMASSGASEDAQQVARQALAAGSSAQGIMGLSAVVLGILALTGLSPIVLVLVAVLIIGGSIIMSGTAVAGKMMAMLSGE